MKTLITNKKIVLFTMAILALGVLFGGVKDASARYIQIAEEPQQAPDDTRISAFTVTPANSSLGATTSYAVSFTLNTAIPTEDIGDGLTGIRSWLRLNMASGNCPWQVDYSLCQPNLSGDDVTISGISATLSQEQWDPSSINFTINSALSAGTVTFTINNVVNASQGGGFYQATLGLNTQDQDRGEGMPWPEEKSASFILGTVAFYGKLLAPDASVVPNTGVNLRTLDGMFNTGTGTDSEGNFVFMATGLTAGTTYVLEVWVPNDSGYVAPNPLSLVYSGTATNLGTITLAQATKHVTGRVAYDTGGVVTTAQISYWRGGGMGGGGGTNVDENGEFELNVSPGEWEFSVSSQWDQETQQPRPVDWTFNQPPTRITFADNNTEETRTVNFTVQKTNAMIKGRALLPNGTPLINGWVDIRQGDGWGNGTGINQNGRFTANVMAGSYKLAVNPDNMNPNLARYYMNEISVSVGENQTLDLGDLVLSQKTSSIAGKVTLEDGTTAVEGVQVNCWNRGGSGWGNATSAADGTYTIWLFAAQWECQVQTDRNSDYIPIQAGGEPKVYDLSDNENITGVNHKVKLADAWLNVRTVDVDGNAVTEGIYGGVYARIKDAGWGPDSEFHSGFDRGTATIPLLGGDTYVVGAWLPSERGYLLDEEEEVTVAVGETADVLLTLVRPDGKIKGFIKDQDGKPITGKEVEVNAWQADNMGPGGGPGMHTRVNQSNGSFDLPVRGGVKYALGYWFHKNDEFIQTHSNEKPFLVPVNGTVSNKVITIFRANTYVDVTLLDPDGKAIDFGFVWGSNRGQLEGKQLGDWEGGKIIDTGTEVREGKARLPLISGTYDIGAGQWKGSNQLMPPDVVEVTVTKNNPASVTLQFSEADATVTGTVTREDGGAVKWGWCHFWTDDGKFTGGDIFDGGYSVPINEGLWFGGCDSFNPEEDTFFRSPEEMITINTTGEITKDFVLQEGDFEIPDGISEQFDSSQQKTLNLPDGTRVEIPASALATSGNVTVTATPDINLFFTKKDKPTTYAWDLEAFDENQQLITEFNSKVTIVIPYDEQYLESQGIDETTLMGKYYDDESGDWKLPDSMTQDTEGNTISVQVTHFTNFAVTTGQATGVAAQAAQGGPVNLVATPYSGGGPQVGVYDKDGNLIATWFAYTSTLRMGVNAQTADLDGDGEVEVVTYPAGGVSGQIRVFDKNGGVLSQFVAGNGLKDIDVAIYDLNGDGTREIIVSDTSTYGGDVWIFDRNGNQLTNVIPASSRGSEVAAADLNGDGTGEIVVYPITGSGHVRIFDGEGNVLAQFHTYGETYNKGINLTLADLDGDGNVEIITTTKDAAAHVKVFDRNGNLLAQFMGYSETFKGGAKAYTGDVDGDGDGEIVLLPGVNGSAQARVFDKDGNLLSQFFAYPQTTRGSFDAVVGDVDNDGEDEIAFAPAVGLGPQVRIFDRNGNALSQFFTLHQGFRGGIKLTTIAQ